MNWHKYTLEQWLEQFGAWCDTAKHDEPDDLGENILYQLMVSTGYVKRHYRNKVVCQISDSEAMAVQNMLNDVLSRADDEMFEDLKLLIDYKVNGTRLDKLAEKTNQSKSTLHAKIHGAKCYIKGLFWLYFS